MYDEGFAFSDDRADVTFDVGLVEVLTGQDDLHAAVKRMGGSSPDVELAVLLAEVENLSTRDDVVPDGH